MKYLRDVPLRYRVASSLIFGGMSLFLFGVDCALVRQANRAAANQAWGWVVVAALVAAIAATGAFFALVAWGALSDPKSRLGAWVQERPLADGVHYAASEALLWGGLFLIYLASGYDIFMGVAVFLCWVPLLLWFLRRGLERDVEALDDSNDSLRTNRLIGRGRERRSYDYRDQGGRE
ncbi:hypothetical protein [Bradyrhizobium sp. CCBAU 53421]|uniref:hypothetical protein n=1 Tax=Bradyrhizobium sp. CCBAU 53421 TaxID=1325120 RepID=UPI00188AA940|nr:hypothetical protein [Bradyrhizobium sp. CCBAU 53421]QOZ33167.1 hypothetical protein XH92_17065 [Bradyrhizobium sp. CCBAU 53421]